jgi:DNA polymerase-3 subunit epsilon
MKLIAGFDTETTGLDQAKGHRIIEVAAILYNLDTGDRVGKFVQRINPQRPIDPGAQAVHGISFEDVSSCPVWDDVAPKLVKILNRCDAIVAHNGESFDMPFLNAELNRVGIAGVRTPLVDTMVQGRWATPMGKFPNLGELCFACGVNYDPEKAHAADYDVEVMMQSFFTGYRRGFFTVPLTKLEEIEMEVAS